MARGDGKGTGGTASPTGKGGPARATDGDDSASPPGEGESAHARDDRDGSGPPGKGGPARATDGREGAGEPGKVIRGIGWNFVGMIAGSVAAFISGILLARWLGSAEYGNLALTLSVLNVLVIFSALGFEFALNKFIPVLLNQHNPKGIALLVRRLSMIKLVLAVAISVVTFFLADILAERFFQKPALAPYFRVLALMVVPYSLEPIYRALLTGFYLQKYLNILDALTKLLFLVLTGAALVLSYGVVGVLFANLLVQAVLLAFAARKGLASIPEGAGRRRAVPLGKVLRYSFYLYVFTIMNFVLGQQLDLIMIGALLPDISQVAYYTIAYSFSYTGLSLLSLVLGGGITLTYFSELYAKKDYPGLRRSYIVMVEYVFIYIIPIAALGMMLAPELLFLFYGPTYAGTDTVMLLMLYFPTMAVMKFGGVTSTFMGAMGQERKLVTSRVIFGSVNITLNFLLIPRFLAFGALVGTGVASIVGLVYESYMVHSNLRPTYPTRFLGRMLAVALAGGTLAGVLRWALLPSASAAGGYSGALIVLCGAGLPALVVTAGLIILLKPLSRETVEVIEKVPLPMKKLILKLLK